MFLRTKGHVNDICKIFVQRPKKPQIRLEIQDPPLGNKFILKFKESVLKRDPLKMTKFQ